MRMYNQTPSASCCGPMLRRGDNRSPGMPTWSMRSMHYAHRKGIYQINGKRTPDKAADGEISWVDFTEKRAVPPGRLELPAQGLGIPCSIRLSYGGTLGFQRLRRGFHNGFEGVL